MSHPRQVRISDRAARDLVNIWQYYRGKGSLDHARQQLKSLCLAIRNVPFTPLGSPPNLESGARERTIDRHTIIYDVEAAEGIGPCAGHVNVLTITGPCQRREGTLH